MFQRPGHKSIPPTQPETSEVRFRRFLRDLNAYEHKLSFDDTLDTFLDLYSAWMKMHEPWMKLRLVTLAFELHELDPAFECNLCFPE